MADTARKAAEITKMNRGKHHIGDFLPKERLEAFLAKCRSVVSAEGTATTGDNRLALHNSFCDGL